MYLQIIVTLSYYVYVMLLYIGVLYIGVLYIGVLYIGVLYIGVYCPLCYYHISSNRGRLRIETSLV